MLPISHKPFRNLERMADDSLRQLTDPYDTSIARLFVRLADEGAVQPRDVATFQLMMTAPALPMKIYRTMADDARAAESSTGTNTAALDTKEAKEARERRVGNHFLAVMGDYSGVE